MKNCTCHINRDSGNVGTRNTMPIDDLATRGNYDIGPVWTRLSWVLHTMDCVALCAIISIAEIKTVCTNFWSLFPNSKKSYLIRRKNTHCSLRQLAQHPCFHFIHQIDSSLLWKDHHYQNVIITKWWWQDASKIYLIFDWFNNFMCS